MIVFFLNSRFRQVVITRSVNLRPSLIQDFFLLADSVSWMLTAGLELARKEWPGNLDPPTAPGPPPHSKDHCISPCQHLGLVRAPGLTSVLSIPKTRTLRSSFSQCQRKQTKKDNNNKMIKKKHQYYQCRSFSRPLVSGLLQHKVFISISRLQVKIVLHNLQMYNKCITRIQKLPFTAQGDKYSVFQQSPSFSFLVSMSFSYD